MKKTLLLLVVLLSALQCTYATHLMGGQLTARQISGLRYEVTLTVYRDTLGIPVYPQEQLIYESLPGTVSVGINTVNVSAPTNILNGVEEYTYTDTFLFPADGQYRISYGSCCRNGAISNLTSPDLDSIYLYTTVTVGAAMINSSPVMLNKPVTIASINVPWIYNPLPYDADGDSLSWTLDQPWLAYQTQCAGYYAPHADPTGPFTLNSLTGEIDWTPDNTGNWNATVLVKEYRAGVQIGEIRRDMQILTVIDRSNISRLAFTGTPALQRNADGYFEYTIPANMPFHLVMNADDTDGDMLNINALGATFEKAVNPSVITTTSGSGHAQATFDWTPTIADVSGKKPYLDVFRGFESHGWYVFMTDLTVAITVVNNAQGTGVTGSDESPFRLSTYPNPVSDQLLIETNAAMATATRIDLCDLSGRVVATAIDGSVQAGRSLMAVSTRGLPAGVYILSGIYGNEHITHKVVVE